MLGKIRIGVVGAGRWGPNLIRNFLAHNHSSVTAVVDKDPIRQKMISDKYPELALANSASELFARADVDAVVIATPTATHFALATQALEAGKHVFVEKPLATDSAQCRKLVALAQAREKVLFVGHIFVYNAGVRAAGKYISSGELGRILYIHATRTNLGPIRTDVNALWDLAPHDISILQTWLKENPTSVSANGACFINTNVEDTAFATYRYRSGVMANIHVSWLNPKKVREIVVVGEKKMLVWDDMDINSPIRIYDKAVDFDLSKEKVLDSFIEFRASIHEGDTLIPKIALNEPLSAECDAFLKAITIPGSSLSTGEEGTAVVQVLEATTQSMAKQGMPVEINYF